MSCGEFTLYGVGCFVLISSKAIPEPSKLISISHERETAHAISCGVEDRDGGSQ